MAEEERIQEEDSSCANNCGFFGSSATRNLCSKCFREGQLKESLATSATLALQNNLPKPARTAAPGSTAAEQEAESVGKATASWNRCFVCRKKVGLSVFKCRCGPTFCGVHRYLERHMCGFDFKGAGREAIARANPMIARF